MARLTATRSLDIASITRSAVSLREDGAIRENAETPLCSVFRRRRSRRRHFDRR